MEKLDWYDIQFPTLNFFSELCPSFLDIRYIKILILLSNTFPVFKINNGKLPNVLGLDTVTSTILTISQQFMRDQKVSYSTLYIIFLYKANFPYTVYHHIMKNTLQL
jgi:hypothetical protein